MTALKLLALDSQDLEVVSAHLQDAVVKVGDMTYEAHAKRFAAVLNRFDWADANGGHVVDRPAGTARVKRYLRRRAALRFERVMRAQVRNLRLDAPEAVLNLLAVTFHPDDPPNGVVTLSFAGDASIRLEVECIEAELRDLGPTWRTASRPDHDDPAPADTAEPGASEGADDGG